MNVRPKNAEEVLSRIALTYGILQNVAEAIAAEAAAIREARGVLQALRDRELADAQGAGVHVDARDVAARVEELHRALDAFRGACMRELGVELGASPTTTDDAWARAVAGEGVPLTARAAAHEVLVEIGAIAESPQERN